MHLCERIGATAREEEELQKSFDAAATPLERMKIERAMDTTFDRRNALMMALAAEQATSLGAVAAQMAAACNLFGRMVANKDPDVEYERAIERLIQSSSQFLNSEATLSPLAAAGIGALFESHVNRWASPALRACEASA
jgi:hypothetical protein